MLAWLHVQMTLLRVALWSLSMLLNPAIKMSSTTCGSTRKSSSTFLWNISPVSHNQMAVICTCTYQKDKEKLLGVMIACLAFTFWYPGLALISIRYLTPANQVKMLLRIGPLWIGLIRTLFNCAGSKHSLTLPFTFGSSVKLLHHSDVSSMSRSTMICCFCSLSSCSHSGPWSAYGILLGRPRYR